MTTEEQLDYGNPTTSLPGIECLVGPLGIIQPVLFDGIVSISFRKANDARYDFPINFAIQCFPESHGIADELDAFIHQIDCFARPLKRINYVSEGKNAGTVHRIALSKLKGTALLQF